MRSQKTRVRKTGEQRRWKITMKTGKVEVIRKIEGMTREQEIMVTYTGRGKGRRIGREGKGRAGDGTQAYIYRGRWGK